MKRLIVSLLVMTSFVLGIAQSERTPSESIAMSGEVTTPMTYTLEDLQALYTQEVEVTFMSGDGEQSHTYKGVLPFDGSHTHL
jgi:hypothetical protein